MQAGIVLGVGNRYSVNKKENEFYIHGVYILEGRKEIIKTFGS